MPHFHRFGRSNPSTNETFKGRHRLEHWYRDNQVYFITARCRDGFPAFGSEEAKEVFWNRFDHYTKMHNFFPWVTSLLNNHYHTLGYLKRGIDLGPMMRKIHGSVAKLVNDTLPARRAKFWRDSSHNDYFDGCIRDESQCRKAYRYTLTQCSRHFLCANPYDYPHTRVQIKVDPGVKRALELKAFLDKLPYPRYALKPNR